MPEADKQMVISPSVQKAAKMMNDGIKNVGIIYDPEKKHEKQSVQLTCCNLYLENKQQKK